MAAFLTESRRNINPWPAVCGKLWSELPYVLIQTVDKGEMVYLDLERGIASTAYNLRISPKPMLEDATIGQTIIYDKNRGGYAIAEQRTEWVLKNTPAIPKEPKMPPEATVESTAVEEAQQVATIQPEPSFEFDGHRFGVSFWQSMPLVYLAKKARDGDVDAAAILNGFTLKLNDADGKQYWPVA